MAEVLEKLPGRGAPDGGAESGSARKGRRENTVGPNLDRLTVGVDLGDRWSQYCILGLKGERLAEGQLRTTQEDVREFFPGIDRGAGSDRSRNSLGLGAGRDHRVGTRGTGGQPAVDGRVEGWQAEERSHRCQQVGALGAGGAAVVVPDSASQSRSAPGSGGAASPGRLGIGADGVDQHHARVGESMGTRLPRCSSPSFAQKVKDAIPVEVRKALLPLVQLVETVNDCIARYDQKIEELGREKYGHTTWLRQVKWVGPITSLAYVLTLEDPQRFASSREVGPYLGLVPKQEDSGDSQPQLGISKTGDRL